MWRELFVERVTFVFCVWLSNCFNTVSLRVLTFLENRLCVFVESQSPSRTWVRIWAPSSVLFMRVRRLLPIMPQVGLSELYDEF